MGEKNVSSEISEHERRQFTTAVLNDLAALEKMIERGMLENGVSRIGAEQELFLVDSSMHPAPLVLKVLESANDPRLTTEIGVFNIEANLTPLDFGGQSLSQLESELNELVGTVKSSAKKFDGDTVLCGILPTIQLSDLVSGNLTPKPRYKELNRVLTMLHGEERMVHIKGIDEIRLHMKDTYSEFCNTSFQIHLQVDFDDFANRYNWAQAITGPVLASAVNSPLLLGHRLWHETRLALFQHSVDERSQTHHHRNRPARVTFGKDWINDSVLDLFHEDVARFRIILTRDIEENALEVLEKGSVPELSAWRLHNGTIWRWNRACYGVMNGKPSLRIEARYLPSGPSIPDEMANAAFFLGLMTALPREYGDVRKHLTFEQAKTNFFMTARFGLRSHLTWLDGKQWESKDLLLHELIPTARRGLELAAIDDPDIDRYLGILQERVEKEVTGSQWILESLDNMDKRAKKNVRMRTLTEAMIKNQESGAAIHEWPLAEIPGKSDWIDNYKTVEQFMTTDLFTVRPEDPVDLAANLMVWKRVRHIPVENDMGELVGVISHRDLLKMLTSEKLSKDEVVVRDVMRNEPIFIQTNTPTLEALNIMRERNIGCLPIVDDGKLVGLLTAHDFLTVSSKLFEERLLEIAQNGEKHLEASGSSTT